MARPYGYLYLGTGSSGSISRLLPQLQRWTCSKERCWRAAARSYRVETLALTLARPCQGGSPMRRYACARCSAARSLQ